MNKEPIIFIDTEDMEERYAEGLYMDYLKEENKQLRDRIDKALEIIESYNLGKYDYNIPQIGIIELLETLKGEYEKD